MEIFAFSSIKIVHRTQRKLLEAAKEIIDQIDVEISGQEALQLVADWSVAICLLLSAKSSKCKKKFQNMKLENSSI